MRKLFLLLIAAMPFASGGCMDDCGGMIWDFACYDICFWVTDAGSNNLMNPETEGNILENGIYVEYRGKEYPINYTATRYNMPKWEGLRTHRDNSPEPAPTLLKFGQFTPESDYRGETFTIYWGDGTSGEVKFDMYITGKDCNPKVHRKLWFNGNEIPVTAGNPYIIHVLK